MRWLLVAAVAGCTVMAVPEDAGLPIDAELFMPDVLSSCGTFPDQSPSGVRTCNLLTQTGCAAGENCSWIWDTSQAGHIGCIPGTGNRVLGQCCVVGNSFASYDNCVKGAVCDYSHVCVLMCDPHGGTPKCTPGTNCTTQPGFLGSAGMEQAGICLP